MKRICCALATLTALLAGVGGARAELINPSFETGDFTGWTVGGNAYHGRATANTALLGNYYSDNVVNVRSGKYAAFADVSQFNNIYFSLQQTVAVVPNTTYDIGFAAGIGVGNPWESAGAQAIIDVNGTRIFSGYYPVKSGLTPSDFAAVNAHWTAPATVTAATVIFYNTGSGDGFVGFSYDDFHFQPLADAPEPSGIALATLAALGLAGYLGRRASD